MSDATILRAELIRAAGHFHRNGWMVGTAGNLSARADADSFWVTASGKAKGALEQDDFVRVRLDGHLLERASEQHRPSAETTLHQVIYRTFPKVGAIYHVHSVEANVVSAMAVGDRIELAPLEMLKGFGVMDEHPHEYIPLLLNHAEVPRISRELETILLENPPRVPAALIKHHGITVWGPNQQAVFNYVELIEFIFRFMVARAAVAR